MTPIYISICGLISLLLCVFFLLVVHVKTAKRLQKLEIRLEMASSILIASMLKTMSKAEAEDIVIEAREEMLRKRKA